MSTIPSQYTNQFQQTPVIGMRDLSLLSGSGAIAFQVSVNQATALKAGDAFILDPTITAVMGMPQVISCANNVAPLGTVAFTNKAVSFTAGDVIEGLVALGPVVFMVANDTIAPGATVERTTTFVQTKSSGAAFGIALDPGVQNQFVRVAMLAHVA